MLINKITHAYESFTLDIENLNLEHNNIIGLIGKNGAGKTTLMDILSQMVKANTTFDVSSYNENDVLYIPTDLEPYTYLTVVEFCKIVLDYSSSEKDVNTIMNDLELLDKENIYISELSKGQQKKLSLINMFLNQYSLVILDEPFNSVDLQYTYEMKNIITALKQTSTVLVSSHIVDTLVDICDEFIYLDNGQVKKVFKNSGNKKELEEELFD